LNNGRRSRQAELFTGRDVCPRISSSIEKNVLLGFTVSGHGHCHTNLEFSTGILLLFVPTKLCPHRARHDVKRQQEKPPLAPVHVQHRGRWGKRSGRREGQGRQVWRTDLFLAFCEGASRLSRQAPPTLSVWVVCQILRQTSTGNILFRNPPSNFLKFAQYTKLCKTRKNCPLLEITAGQYRSPRTRNRALYIFVPWQRDHRRVGWC
jgi:hypothetical protein